MENILIIGVVGLIVGLAAGYIWKQKKRGAKCIGCPDAASCSGQCGSCNGCGCGKH